MQQIIVIGGGISGLSAAYFLSKQAAQKNLDLCVHLLERRDRLGGVMLSETIDGFLLEGGPDSFLTQKKAAVELCHELGLSGELIPSNDKQRKTYILQNGKLKTLPDGLMFMVPSKLGAVFRSDLFSPLGKLRLALTPLFRAEHLSAGEDVSVAEFISQRLGSEALDRLAEPLLSAVYGAEVSSLSSQMILPRFIELERRHGSLWRGIRKISKSPVPASQPSGGTLFVSLRQGVGQLAEALESNLSGIHLHRRIEATGISEKSGGGFVVQSKLGEIPAEAVIFATPSHAAAAVLGGMDPALAGGLSSIPYHSSVTVSLAYPEGRIARPLDGFGFVVPRSEGRELIACTWVSTKYPSRCPSGSVLLRAFLGASRNPRAIEQSDSWVLETTLRELGQIMGVPPDPMFTRIHRWERAMPQYNVGHLRRVDEIKRAAAAHPGLFLCGNAYKGIGIPDCIDSAQAAATDALAHLALNKPA